MKISVLTPTYNRSNKLKKLYESIVQNSRFLVEVEWLIMDDGSTDDTKNKIEELCGENKINISYFYQENQGKMQALNNLVDKADGDLIIECDSDDYFTDNAFEVIKRKYDEVENNNEYYALCFLKFDQNGKNMGNNFKKNTNTMFDLYFKQGENGEKALVFYNKIRKKYLYKLENGEKFITEARMYHKMDQKYKMICVNEPIMICEYQDEGYTKNIEKQFINNPYGYLQYFKEILQMDMKGVSFNKRLYVIKHYILFLTLTKQKNKYKEIKGIFNKIIFSSLYIPGTILTKNKFKTNKKRGMNNFE